MWIAGLGDLAPPKLAQRADGGICYERENSLWFECARRTVIGRLVEREGTAEEPESLLVECGPRHFEWILLCLDWFSFINPV